MIGISLFLKALNYSKGHLFSLGPHLKMPWSACWYYDTIFELTPLSSPCSEVDDIAFGGSLTLEYETLS